MVKFSFKELSVDGDNMTMTLILDTGEAKIEAPVIIPISAVPFLDAMRTAVLAQLGAGFQQYMPLLDVTPPVVAIVSPVADQELPPGDFVASGTALDDFDVVSVKVSIDGGDPVDAEGLSNWTAAIPGLSAGEHTIEVKAKDQAGNEGTASVTFTVSAE